MTTHYEAQLVPLNAEKIGSAAYGHASFDIDGDTLTIKIDMHGTPANTEHWEHFHGFPDGKQALIATAAQDANGDGFVDLPETEPVSGTTMVPFDDAPEKMDIPHDRYPVADANGDFSYEQKVPLSELSKNFKSSFNDEELQLDKRVIYIHGTDPELTIPDTVQGMVGHFDQHVTLPIATGQIEAID
ncbi:hypothetical protein AYR62_12475 [Secundilactobacillus paracollinoides]|uniref:CHRD domain-containing protein n=1 Tax=Secundilactobacillus paracollinoides TaxID=240427 RepID=A0A1B2IWC9_9LACO|nr:hypothetical protein [Secundilactobacillus paracollinoides]ANZ60502.1 hypothetical protein AYR61_03505 [Secundilactobacillus paracollinoides]ANZ64814.1 hypothetical protein AYR62_12475 [Secundilactobacillus paracollinoides]ANZ66329.1 hypothetical protein AYR63_03700 [Secundilactobacillus paracollinoides]KRL81644.1 hypothetical protein FC17_GL001625 [Secundilactobacillus paracollinoides DSM 15502 = JCM 11969]